jgi:hypothetical protein
MALKKVEAYSGGQNAMRDLYLYQNRGGILPTLLDYTLCKLSLLKFYQKRVIPVQ